MSKPDHLHTDEELRVRLRNDLAGILYDRIDSNDPAEDDDQQAYVHAQLLKRERARKHLNGTAVAALILFAFTALALIWGEK